MKIYEYQAVELFKEYGINVPPCKVIEDASGAYDAARQLGGKVVCKAQVLVGGRGKAGGIKSALTPDEAVKKAEKIFAMNIKSIPVKKVLISKLVSIKKEYYLGITIDRTLKKVVFIMSSSGGVDIETIAKETPDKIHKLYVVPRRSEVRGQKSEVRGLGTEDSKERNDENELKSILRKVFEGENLQKEAYETLMKMYKLFTSKDLSLVEINPCVETAENELIAVDAKIVFDDNGLFKHSEIEKLKSLEEYTEAELEAKEANLSYVSMDGDIGCIVNGAGLAMATMDVIKLFGGSPANFLDVGGSSSPDKVLKALKVILADKKVKAILINIFGGITRCDDIAAGITMSIKKLEINVPLIIRLIGTNENEGRNILKEANLVACESMTEAVRKVVEYVI